MATSEGTLKDPQFDIEAPNALQLRRTVEMYQWEQDEKRETRKKLGGGEETVTTYTYEKIWSDNLLDSGSYKEKDHDNPERKPYESESWQAEDAKVGAFALGELTGQVDAWATVPLNEESYGKLPVVDGLLYSGADPKSPKIGDARIKLDSVQPRESAWWPCRRATASSISTPAPATRESSA